MLLLELKLESTISISPRSLIFYGELVCGKKTNKKTQETSAIRYILLILAGTGNMN
tara:strand:+ start:465 stop:632 length:168 start_codon:yes stop_codon:yes gene_type:complete